MLSGGSHAAPGAARIIEWEDPDRFLAGVALYQSKRAPLLLFTGGQNPFHPGLAPEGELYRSKAVALGVPRAAIAMTPVVRNTAEEAGAIRQLLPGSQPRVLLVTSAFHMQRARRLFERQGITVVPFPVDFKARASWSGSLWRDPLQWLPNSRSLDDSSSALRELLGHWSIAHGESDWPVNPFLGWMISVRLADFWEMLIHASLADSVAEIQAAMPHHVILKVLPGTSAIPDLSAVAAAADQTTVLLQTAEFIQQSQGFTAQLQQGHHLIGETLHHLNLDGCE